MNSEKMKIVIPRKFTEESRAVELAIPVAAFECEAFSRTEKKLDAYEEAVLKLVATGYSANMISSFLGAGESMTEGILCSLRIPGLVDKIQGQPWTVTDKGIEYIKCLRYDMVSKDSRFGYMFADLLRRDVIPYFFEGSPDKLRMYRGTDLPYRITLKDGRELDQSFKPARRTIESAYRKFCKASDMMNEIERRTICVEEARSMFSELECFDETIIEDTPEPTELNDTGKPRAKLIRALDCEPRYLYLTMRIVIDPAVPGGYTAESPFPSRWLDNGYFMRLIRWCSANDAVIYGEALGSFIEHELNRFSVSCGSTEGMTGFLTREMPCFKACCRYFLGMYEDFGEIYPLMQKENKTAAECRGFVSSVSSRIAERLLNGFFRDVSDTTAEAITEKAKEEMKLYDCGNEGCELYIKKLLAKTDIAPENCRVDYALLSNAVKRLAKNHGNSILEKLVGLIITNYYLGTARTKRLFSGASVSDIFLRTRTLSRIRNKAVHDDTDDPFTEKDCEFYKKNVFRLINELCMAYLED